MMRRPRGALGSRDPPALLPPPARHTATGSCGVAHLAAHAATAGITRRSPSPDSPAPPPSSSSSARSTAPSHALTAPNASSSRPASSRHFSPLRLSPYPGYPLPHSQNCSAELMSSRSPAADLPSSRSSAPDAAPAPLSPLRRWQQHRLLPSLQTLELHFCRSPPPLQLRHQLPPRLQPLRQPSPRPSPAPTPPIPSTIILFPPFHQHPVHHHTFTPTFYLPDGVRP